MKLNLYDSHLNRVAIIGNLFRSCLWAEGYNTIESGVVELPVTEDYRQKIRPDCYIGRDDRPGLMVVKSVQERDQSIVLSCKQATRILDDLAFIGTLPSGFTVDSAISAAYNKSTKIPFLSFPAGPLKIKCSHQIGSRSFWDLCQVAAESTDTGIQVVRSPGGMTAQFYHPEEDPNLIFSESFGNLAIDSVNFSTEKYKNYAIVLGQGEGEKRIRVDVNQSAGKPRRELVVDARDLRQEEGETLDKYKARLKARGEDYLLDYQSIWNAAFHPLSADFGTRYDLGDILTVRLPGYGLTLKARVTKFSQKEQKNKIKTTISVGQLTITR